MDAFKQILNWKLKVGSHPFPGKDGGTCINEAAVVAAGFEYRRVRSPEDMPECFSRPICRFAMRLNDEANDFQRQHLLPFVTRLACADTPEVERKRAIHIACHEHCLTFEQRLQVLEGALAIGRQADPLGPDQVRTRMDEARGRAATVSSAPDLSLAIKLKSWFAAMT